MALFDRLFRKSAPSAPMQRGKAGAAYFRHERSPVFFDWNPVLRDSREDVRDAWWRGAARTIDMIHNAGWIAGVVNKGCASILGNGLRLAFKPDYGALGWDDKATQLWAREVERRWELWSSSPIECDASGKLDVHQMAKAATRSYFGLGEWVAWMKWIDRPESLTGTKIQLIPAHRLVQQSNGVDLYQGVRIDKNGMPIAYQFRFAEPIIESGQITEILARVANNRTVIKHCFDGDIGQMRGISPFAPVLQTLRQYDQLANATLTKSLVQAIFAATVESPSPTQDVLAAFETPEEQGVGGNISDYLNARTEWYDNTKIDLGGMGRIAHLFTGEKLNFLRSDAPNSTYEPFARFLLREIAACGGFTFEDVTGDYTGATYSAIKMSTTTNWPIQTWRRTHIAAPFYQAAFACWLEESIIRGETTLPGDVGDVEVFFAKNRAALCRAEWRGPGKPVPDDVKFAAANETLYKMGVITGERIAAELNGEDIEDIYDQLAREKEMRAERGLPDPEATTDQTALKAAMKTEDKPDTSGKGQADG